MARRAASQDRATRRGRSGSNAAQMNAGEGAGRGYARIEQPLVPAHSALGADESH